MLVRVKVFPHSKKEEVIEKSADRLEVKIRAKAERGLANAAVIGILSGHFGVAPEKIRIIRGQKSRNKMIEIAS